MEFRSCGHSGKILYSDRTVDLVLWKSCNSGILRINELNVFNTYVRFDSRRLHQF